MAPVSSTSSLTALRAIGPERAVGWIGLDVPLELIDAAGLVPLHVTADPGAPSPAAEPYGEGVGHPLVRALTGAVIELAEAGLRRLWVASTPAHNVSLVACLASLQRSCAVLQGLGITTVDLLHGDSPADHAHNISAFRRLASEFAGRQEPGEAALWASIARYNLIRERLAELDRRRCARMVSGSETLAIHAEGGRLPADTFLRRLGAKLAEAPGSRASGARPIVVSGSSETAEKTYPVYEASGLIVVGDDHDAGSRAIGPRVAQTGDPFEALAERYRRRTPAPSGWSTAKATEALLALARRQGAEAVAFDIPLYDHPAAWDFPAKRAALEAAGIACVLLPPDAFRDPAAAARQAAEALGQRRACGASDA